MHKRDYLFTSESVTEGHPDKTCDQISDSILDAIILKDSEARVACETLVTTGLVFITGEITTKVYVDIPPLIRKLLKEIGYTKAKYGFDYETCAILTSIEKQSSDIALGVDKDGAGDQGLMFGYATDETPELMPLPIMLAHKLTMRLTEARKDKILPYLRPDGKSQVTVEYVNGKPKYVEAVVVSTQHSEKVDIDQLRKDVQEYVIDYVIPKELCAKNIKYYINPTGRFVHGGPKADSGLTGRKIIVDTYGGVGSHGGGCFSGKDPTKVDRSASYMARHIAKNIVAAKFSKKCEVQLAYAIGVSEPVSILVNTFGTGKEDDKILEKLIRKVFPLTPKGIIKHLNLLRPIYRLTASYGHFGRELEEFTWESTHMVPELKKVLKKIK